MAIRPCVLAHRWRPAIADHDQVDVARHVGQTHPGDDPGAEGKSGNGPTGARTQSDQREPVPSLTITSATLSMAMRRNRCSPWKKPDAVASKKMRTTEQKAATSTHPLA